MTTTTTPPVLVLGEDAHLLREGLRHSFRSQRHERDASPVLGRHHAWCLDAALPPTEAGRAVRRALVRLDLHPVYAAEESRVLLTVLLLHVLEALEDASCHDRH